MASVLGLSFCPPRLTHLLLTAGIDSTNSFPRQHFPQASFCWFKLSMKYSSCYSSAISFFFRELIWAVRSTNGQSDEELTGQPDQHHRVVLQPPPSLDSGLDSRSVFALFPNSLLLPYKGYDANTHIIGESFARIVLGHIRRFSFSKQDQHHRMLILGVNFCPCKNSLIETLFCTYCHYVRNKSSKLHETDFFSLALRSKVQVRRELVQPTFGMGMIGQLWRAPAQSLSTNI